MEKLIALGSWIKARLSERSTWAFWFGSIGVAFAMDYPGNMFAFAAVFFAGFIPDTVLTGKQDG